ncbi:MAG: 8-amino-7-oxononanoate synthase [Pirellulaceae bacterium]|nr:8-amino-7-oxononanoate synthase [Pirellulaceae bacterium]
MANVSHSRATKADAAAQDVNSSWLKHFAQGLDALQQHDLLRVRGGLLRNWHVTEDGAEPLDFGNNDYLGLRRHPQVIEAARCGLLEHGWGSGASPVLSGYSELHAQLERQLAELCGTQESLVFSSGYAANVGSLSAWLDRDCLVLSDQLNHASLIDGMRLSRACRIIYPHCHVGQLEQLLLEHRRNHSRALIVTESVFSMDGDEAPLVQIAELAERFDCGLVVDEAHAVGLFGQRGSGLLEELELTGRVLLKLGTLSKALGGLGGYAAGSRWAVQHLVNRCRSYIFSTAPPAAAMAASLAAAELLPKLTVERQQLLDLARYLRDKLSAMGWPVSPGRSPIVPLVVGDAWRAVGLSGQLARQGIYVPAIRPPTVPENTSRLRISLSANHRRQDIDRLCLALGNNASLPAAET